MAKNWRDYGVAVGKSSWQSSIGDKQHQISRGDNYNKFYLLLLFDHRGLGFGVLGLGFGGLSLRVLGVIGGLYVHTLV